MFGIEHEITDGSLYMLSDLTDDLLEKELKKLEALPDNDFEKRSKISSQIRYHQTQIDQFKTQIEKQLQEKFQFSIEELYAMHGQYDKYLSFEFHKYSESAQKFGRRIHGIITYLKSERENLEVVVSQEMIPRTNDLVKIDCSTDETLSDIQKKELLESGVKVGDIHQILSPALPKIKSFNNPGKKEIPNTITVNFDPADFDPNRSFFGLYSQKIKSGEKLIEDELEKFCGVALFLYPELTNSTFIKEHGVNADGSLKTSVRFYELEAKSYEGCLQDDELIVFEKLLASKREDRIKAIKYEISRSTNKKLEDFKKEYPEIYKELEKSISEFQTESLVYYGMEKPIYWDYESYLHIFLRHCEELAIEGRFEIKTKFQYYSEDIKRILKIAIKSLSTQINEKLKAGKFYRLSGDKSLYFNGNHYSIHILESGRVAAFHPLENPKNK